MTDFKIVAIYLLVMMMWYMGRNQCGVLWGYL